MEGEAEVREVVPKGVHPVLNLLSCTKKGLGTFKEGLASRGGRAGKEQGSQREREGEEGRGTKKEREKCVGGKPCLGDQIAEHKSGMLETALCYVETSVCE